MGPANSGANASRSLLRAPRFALSSSRQPLFDAEGSASCAGRVTIHKKTARALQSPAIVPPRALRQAGVLERAGR